MLRHPWLIFTIAACLSTLLSCNANARSVWFGFADSGQGTGMMGHGFLVVAEDDVTLFYGDAYTYGVTASSGEHDNVFSQGLAMIGLGLRFKQEKLPFNEIFSYYTNGENRSLTLIELNLTNQEVTDLIRLLERDSADQDFHKREQYDLLSNNCVTYPIKLINQVVSQERHIYLANILDFNFPSKNFRQDPSAASLSRIPLYLMRHLQGHALAKGSIEKFESLSKRQAHTYLNEWTQGLAELADCYGWNQEFTHLFAETLLAKRTSPEADVKSLTQLIKVRGCGDSKTKWVSFLTSYNDLIPFSNAQFKRKVYYVKSLVRK